MDTTYLRCFGLATCNAIRMIEDRGFDVSSIKLADPVVYASRAYVASKATGRSMGETLYHVFKHATDAQRVLALWVVDRNFDVVKGRDRMVSTDQMKAIMERIHESAATEHVIVVPSKLSPQARREVGIERLMSVWTFDDLVFDLPRHWLMLPHTPVTKEAMQAVLGPFMEPAQLPRLPRSDPVARWFGFAEGTIVFIDRPDLPSFRVVA